MVLEAQMRKEERPICHGSRGYTTHFSLEARHGGEADVTYVGGFVRYASSIGLMCYRSQSHWLRVDR